MSPQPSAVDKAELRRQKILAKKNARMAYAAGDHSRLPSSAPTEQIKESALRPVASATQTRRSEGIGSFPVGQSASKRHANSGRSRSSLSGILKVSWFRSLILSMTAIAFAFAMRMGFVEVTRISAVELFACAELGLQLPYIMMGIQALLKRTGGGGSVLSALWIISCAQEVYRVGNEVMRDFCAYMMCFLYAWFVLGKQWG